MISLGVIQEVWGRLRDFLVTQRLFEFTEMETYPIPTITRILCRLSKAKYVTSIGFSDPFWQVELDHDSRPKTAFSITGSEYFQYTRMSFRLCNSTVTLEKLVDKFLFIQRNKLNEMV